MELQNYYPDHEPHFKLYCVESVQDTETHNHSKLWSFLEELALKYNIHNIYKACDDLESFEASLEQLIHGEIDTSDFKILYFVLEGEDNEIVLNDYVYSLEEIAEMFEGKFHDKIIHFANTKSLDLEEETFQYFLDVTGAVAISGYTHPNPIPSFVLDLHYFSLYRKINEVVELVHQLYKTHAKLYHAMGFKLYY